MTYLPWSVSLFSPASSAEDKEEEDGKAQERQVKVRRANFAIPRPWRWHLMKLRLIYRVRQDVNVMLAGFDAADAMPSRAKKARTVFPDSDCETEIGDNDSNTRSSTVGGQTFH